MKIEIPTECPCCSYKLIFVNEQLFCRNPECSAQLSKKLEHFTKTLGIKGFGPKSIEKLNLSDVTELFYLDKETVTSALSSEKLATKLLLEIEKAKMADLATVLEAFSIPLLGGTASKKIAEVVSSVEEITLETCKSAGLGDKVTTNLLNWLNTEYQELKEFLPFSFESRKQQYNNKASICITGKLFSFPNKAEAYSTLQQYGFSPVESVTKQLNYLVDEEDNSSAKRLKAEKYGIFIIKNLKDFLSQQSKEIIK